MLLGRSILLVTSESRETLVARLSAVILPTRAVAPLKPVRVVDWVAQHRGKRFVGTIEGQHFKLGVVQEPSAGFRWRGSVVVIVGSIEGQSLRVRLRPPVFILAFLGAFATAMSAVLALSFFGPSNTPTVHWLLACGLVLPVAVVVWFFRREASEAEHALRQAIEGRPASSQPPFGKGDAMNQPRGLHEP
jgi:hypothetical protein